ncbi:cysteine protease StiP domain-containing protein [Methylorubrum thiocyanatum]|uniref:cysteine protease StiP domain-containing protein n=1 Tax=Methylorubrum thiocyanatum TaxID=47958 RepID=UPI00383B5ED0
MNACNAVAAHAAGFHGSYAPPDVEFLLRPIAITPVGIVEKERLIQSGRRHYSEMLSAETAPSPAYAALYHSALDAGARRFGRDAAALALALFQGTGQPMTLVSLVRAGVPLGVLLRRALVELGADVAHFGISIVRDRGIDTVALDHVLARRPADGLVFVDGWTGKGAIASELAASLAGHPTLSPRLVTLADVAGRAWLSASGEDWLIPSGILGATVSGLTSRSVLNDALVGPGQFHACAVQSHLAGHDVSRAFVDAVWPHVEAALDTVEPAKWTDADRFAARSAAEEAVASVVARFGVMDRNRIKPGIAEATRAVLRRVPERVLITDPGDPDLAPLVALANSSSVTLDVLGPALGPYRAITLIRKVD